MLPEKMERWIQEEKQEGRREGRREGKQEGLKLAIYQVYKKQFSRDLPNALKQQVETASSERLQIILDKILSQQMVDEEMI